MCDSYHEVGGTPVTMPQAPVFRGFFIGGEFVSASSPRLLPLCCPATAAAYATVPPVTSIEVERAVGAARRAFDDGSWSLLRADERVAILQLATENLRPSFQEIARVAAFEIGAPVSLTESMLEVAVSLVARLGEIALTMPHTEEAQGLWDYVVQRQPYGVVVVISPWNGPMFETIVKSSMALLSGNSVISKPPPLAPFVGQYWGESLTRAGLPAGVFSILPADAQVSQELVIRREVDKIAFTGGTSVGRKIAELCGANLKRVVLELGGKSAAVVLEDADLDVVAQAVASGSFFNSGQVCSALTRVVVPRRLAAETAERIAEIGSKIVIGDPFDPETSMGPMASASHFERVQKFVALGREQGARLVTGGRRPPGLGPGWYFEPTVFADVKSSMRISQEEIFGPVVAVIAHDGEGDAVRIANDSEYGLGGSVFSADAERALGVAGRLQTGSVTINGFTSNFLAPRDPHKSSGTGVMTGAGGYRAFQSSRIVNLRPAKGAWVPGSKS